MIRLLMYNLYLDIPNFIAFNINLKITHFLFGAYIIKPYIYIVGVRAKRVWLK
jgi:hypothetical protein